MSQPSRFDPHAPDADATVPVNTRTRVSGTITLVEPDPAWPALFRREAQRIRAALGRRAIRIAHMGSTAVPGLPAKPCIDILLAVADAGDDAAWVPDLQRSGYVLRISETYDGHDHRVFKGREINLNLHVWSAGSSEIDRHLAFRDWLRAHPDDRDRYAAVKRDLSSRHWEVMQDYADAKDAVVAEITARMHAGRTP